MPAQKYIFTGEIENKIVELLQEGKNFGQIAQALELTASAIFKHREKYPLFASRVSSARILGVERLVEELESVADNYADPQRGRLKSDNLKFIIQHRDPANWSDKIQIDVNQTVSIQDALNEANTRIRNIIEIPKIQLADTTIGIVDAATGSKPVESDESPTISSLDDLLS